MSKTKKLSLTILTVIAVLALVGSMLCFGTLAALAEDNSVLGTVSGSQTISDAVNAPDKYLVGGVAEGQEVNLTINASVDVSAIAPADVLPSVKIVGIASGVTIKTRQKIDNTIFAINDSDGNPVGIRSYEMMTADGSTFDHYEYTLAGSTSDGKGYVAESGGQMYTSLQLAINNGPVNNGIVSVKMLCNRTESITIPAGKTVHLDMDGYTLTNTAGQHTITVEAGAVFSGVGIGGTVDNVTHACAALKNQGTATLTSGVYTRSAEAGTLVSNGGNSYYVIENNGGNLTIENATVTADGGWSSLVINVGGTPTEPVPAQLTINGGTFSGGLNTVKNDGNASAVINGGHFSNTAQAVVLNWNDLTINGGTFEASGSAAAAVISCYAAPSVGEGHTTITDGTFRGSLVASALSGATVGHYDISGGNFSEVPKAAWLESGFGINTDSKTEDGLYAVEEGDFTYLAELNDAHYTSFESALAEAADGDTITLLGNVGSITVGKAITLDLATYTASSLTVTADATITGSNIACMVSVTSGNVTVRNATISALAGVLATGANTVVSIEDSTITGTVLCGVLASTGAKVTITNSTVSGGNATNGAVSAQNGSSVELAGTTSVSNAAGTAVDVKGSNLNVASAGVTITGATAVDINNIGGISTADISAGTINGAIDSVVADFIGASVVMNLPVNSDYLKNDVVLVADGDGYKAVEVSSADFVANVSIGNALVHYTSLQAAIDAAAEGETVTLVKNITITQALDGTTVAVLISRKSITLDGAGHSITTSVPFAIYIVAETPNYASLNKDYSVTLRNLKVVGTAGNRYGVKIRGGRLALALENVEIDVTAGENNAYALDFGGIAVEGRKVTATVSQSKLISSGAKSQKAISACNPVALTITNSDLSGRAAIYLRTKNQDGTGTWSLGTSGSTVSITGGSITTVDNFVGTSEVFGAFVFESDNVSLSVNGANINVSTNQTTVWKNLVHYSAYVPAGGTASTPRQQIDVDFVNCDITLSEGIYIAIGGAAPALAEQDIVLSGTDTKINVAVESHYIADGLGLVYGENGYTLAEGTPVAAVVVGDKEYAYLSIANAIAACGGNGTIKLLADVTESVVVADGQSLTLNLNGKTLTNTDGSHTITNNGSLTLTGSGKVINNSAGCAALHNLGTATVEAVEVTRENSDWYVILNQGEMEINGANVHTTTTGSSLVKNGWEGDENEPVPAGAVAKLTIVSGTLEGGLNCVKNDAGGTLEILGGTFTLTGSSAAVLNWHNATIKDGTFNTPENSGSAVQNCRNDATGSDGVLAIEGGTFNGSVTNDDRSKAATTISGGSFAVIPAYTMFADGKVVDPTNAQNGLWTVEEGSYVAYGKIKDATGSYNIEAGFVTLADALNYETSKNVYLLKGLDLTAAEEVSLIKAKTLWLNGHNITSSVTAIKNNTSGNYILAINGNGTISTTGNGPAIENVSGKLNLTDNVKVQAVSGTALKVSGGTVELKEAAQLVGATALDVANGATLKVGTSNANKGVVIDGAITVAEGGTVTLNHGTVKADLESVLAILASGRVAVAQEDGSYVVMAQTDVVATIGKVGYMSLEAAVEAIRTSAGKSGTVVLQKDASGNGIALWAADGVTLTIDLNGHTYNANGTLVGSPNTQTQAFHFEKGNTVTIKNGNLASENAGMLIQNYSNLTLESVNIDGANVPNAVYLVSNNNGETVITGSTTILATSSQVAFDVYYWPNAGYESVKVTLDENFTGTIDGKIEVAKSGAAAQPTESVQNLVIKSGTILGEIDNSTGASVVDISGGSFAIIPSADCFADGFVIDPTAEKDENGLYVVRTGSYVASIDGIGYISLADAIEAAVINDTIKLLADVKESVVVAEGQSLTLDLNGKTLTNTDGSHTITNNGTLTITGNGTVDNVSHARAALLNYGTATLLGGTYTRSQENGSSATESGGNSYYVLDNKGTLTIGEDGAECSVSVTQNGSFSSLVENGWYNGNQNVDQTPATLVIYGGTFTGGINTIKNDDWGVATIHGGSFVNMSQHAVLNWNDLTINGGTFEAKDDATIVLYTGYGNDSMDIGTTVINGGNFKGILTGNGSETVEISGGNFTVIPNHTYFADGFVIDPTAEKDANGYYAVSEGSFVATISGSTTGYVKVEDAIAAANNNADVVLLADVESIGLTAAGTLDLNGKTVGTITSTASLVIKGEGIVTGDVELAAGEIKGGTYHGAVKGTGSESDLVISGGTYKVLPSNVTVASGSAIYGRADGWYIIAEASNALATMEVDGKTVGFYKISDALSFAGDATYIELAIVGSEITEQISVADGVTLKLTFADSFGGASRGSVVLEGGVHDISTATGPAVTSQSGAVTLCDDFRGMVNIVGTASVAFDITSDDVIVYRDITADETVFAVAELSNIAKDSAVLISGIARSDISDYTIHGNSAVLPGNDGADFWQIVTADEYNDMLAIALEQFADSLVSQPGMYSEGGIADIAELLSAAQDHLNSIKIDGEGDKSARMLNVATMYVELMQEVPSALKYQSNLADAKAAAVSEVILYANAMKVDVTEEVAALIEEIKAIGANGRLVNVANAKQSALDQIDRDVLKLQIAKDDAIAAVTEAAADDVALPTSVLAAINAATSVEEVEAVEANGIAEIQSIRSTLAKIDTSVTLAERIAETLSQMGADVAAIQNTVEVLKRALQNGQIDGSDTILVTMHNELISAIARVQDQAQAVYEKVEFVATAEDLNNLSNQIAALDARTLTLEQMNGALQGVQDAINSTIQGVQDTLSGIVSKMETLADGEDIQRIIGSINALASSALTVDDIHEALDGTLQDIKDQLTIITRNVNNVISTLGNVASASSVQQLQQSIDNLETVSQDQLAEALAAVQSAVTGAVSSALSEMKQDIATLTGKLSETAQSLTEQIASLGSSLGGSTSSALTDISAQIAVLTQKVDALKLVESAKEDSVRQINNIIDELIQNISYARAVAATSPVAVASTSNVMDSRVLYYKLVGGKYTSQQATLIVGYYESAIKALNSATTIAETTTIVESFRGKVATVDALATVDTGVDLTAVYVLVAVAILLAAAAVVLAAMLIKRPSTTVVTVSNDDGPAGGAPAEEPVEEEAAPEEVEEPAPEEVEEPAQPEEEEVPQDEEQLSAEEEAAEAAEEAADEAEGEAAEDSQVAEGEVASAEAVDDTFAFSARSKSRPFSQRLAETSDENLQVYSTLKNALCSYKRVKGRMSKKCESFRIGRELVAKITIVGKSVRMYIALDPSVYDATKFRHKDMSHRKSYALVPMMVRVRGPRATKRALLLIDDCLSGKNKNTRYVPVDYAAQIREQAAAENNG